MHSLIYDGSHKIYDKQLLKIKSKKSGKKAIFGYLSILLYHGLKS